MITEIKKFNHQEVQYLKSYLYSVNFCFNNPNEYKVQHKTITTKKKFLGIIPYDTDIKKVKTNNTVKPLPLGVYRDWCFDTKIELIKIEPFYKDILCLIENINTESKYNIHIDKMDVINLILETEKGLNL